MEKPGGWKKRGRDRDAQRRENNAAALLSDALSYINDLQMKIQQLESQLSTDQEVTSREREVEVEVEVKIMGADEAVVRVQTKNMRHAEARLMEALRDLELKLHHATISNSNNITSQHLVVGLPLPLQTTQQEKMEEGSGDEKKKKKISALVVDDEAVIRHIHMSLLRKLNVEEVEAAENGKAAVDAFQRGASFDLVLMDLEMPLMDGAQATKELRKMGVEGKIVGVTADGAISCEKKAAFMEAGLDHCLMKPLTLENLRSLLQQFNT